MARDAWLEKYRTGSFRGVEFKTRASTVTGGRRKVDREFAKRELGNSEDIGKKLKTFSLDLYVLGSDYFEQRDALEEALDTPGAGELIHPYRGTLQVQVGTYSINETVDETRIARFTVEFSESGEVKFPDLASDDIADAVTAADEVAENSKNFFENVLDTVSQAAFVIQAAADDTKALVADIESAVQNITEPVASVTFAIRNLNAAVDSLIQLPGQLADQIQGVFDDLFSVFEDEPETTNRIMGAFLGGVDATIAARPVVGTTPSRITQGNNQRAISNLFKELSLSTQAKAAVDVDFNSTRDALDTRNEVVDGLDSQIDQVANQATTDDELFQSFKDLQTALSRALPRTGTSELLTFTPEQTTPAIVIAYDLFEELEKEDEIIDQNDVEHPGFVPGGDEIEVSAG